MSRHALARQLIPFHRSRLVGVTALAALALLTAIVVPSAASVADPSATPPASTVTQATIDLGTAGAYSVMASTALTSAGGTSAGLVGGSNSSIPLQAQQDLTAAYNAAAALTPTALIAGDLGGRVITPGVYHAGAALAMSTSVTFDALGDPNAVFVFQVGAAMNTTAASHMLLANGAQASHIFWQVLGAVTTGASSSFVGTILGNAAITAGAGTTIDGRALTQGGAVTLSNVSMLAVADVAINSTVSPSVDVQAGDAVVFTDVIRNSGNVPISVALSGSSLATASPSGTGTTVAWPDDSRVLAVGQSVSASTPYLPTLADAAAGAVSASETVTATPQASASFSATSTATLVVYPTPVADSVSTTATTPITFNVLTNDAGADSGATFSRAALAASPRLIGGAVGPVPASPLEGSVTCVDSGVNTGECTYQPAGSFTGTDSFDYSLAQGTRTWNVHVTVAVTAGVAAAPTARAARVIATTGGPAVTFDPTANSTDPGTGSLAILSSSALPSAEGSLSCSGALCTFTPSASFTGIASATYREADVSPSGVQGTPSAVATISIFVDPAPLDATGFVTGATTAVAVSTGTFAASTTTAVAAGNCSSGRPSTAVSWQASPGATSWVVQRRSTGATTGDWITVATLPASALSYLDAQLGEGNSYQWQVRPDLGRWMGSFSAPSAVSGQAPAVDARGC
jgi:hypothetical protein